MAIVTNLMYLSPGDIVANTAQVYRVQRVKQVKATCLGMDGQMWDIRIDSPTLREATEDEKRAFNEKHPINAAPTLRLGNFVRFTGNHAVKFPGVYVVIKDKGTSVSLVKAGGNLQGQYFATVLTALIEKVEEPVKLQNV